MANNDGNGDELRQQIVFHIPLFLSQTDIKLRHNTAKVGYFLLSHLLNLNDRPSNKIRSKWQLSLSYNVEFPKEGIQWETSLWSITRALSNGSQ